MVTPNFPKSQCWAAAYELIANGEIERAIAICKSDKCSSVMECQRYLGWSCYEKGDVKNALVWFTKAADQEDGEALFGIGSVYVAQREFRNALEYFERSANQGYARSYQWIAGIYQHGCGVPMDINKAVCFYKEGASRGYVMAERSLINIASVNGNVFEKLLSMLKLVLLQIRTAKIAYRNIDDNRLADVQLKANYFCRDTEVLG